MSEKISRRDFLKKAGLLGFAGAFGFTKLGTLTAQAAVSDNTSVKNITKDQIVTSEVDATTDLFKSGQSAADLAKALNTLSKQVADMKDAVDTEIKNMKTDVDSEFIKKTDLEFNVDGEDLSIVKKY